MTSKSLGSDQDLGGNLDVRRKYQLRMMCLWLRAYAGLVPGVCLEAPHRVSPRGWMIPG